MDKNYIIRRGLSAAVSFIVSVFAALSVLCVVLLSVCSESFVGYIIKQSNYLEHSYRALQTHLSDLTIPSGLPEDFFESRIDRAIYESRALEAVSCNIEKTEPSFTGEELKNEFYTLAYGYAVEHNYAIGDDSYESLWGFAEECCDSYIKYVNPSSVKYVLGYFGMIKNYSFYALAVAATLTLISSVLLYFLTRGRDFKKHLIFALSADVLFFTLLPFILLISGEIRKVALTSKALYYLTVTYVEGLLWLLLLFGGLFAAAVAALAVSKKLTAKHKIG